MSVFLILMIAGLFGMALMSIPAFGRHGHGATLHGQVGHTLPHAGQGMIGHAHGVPASHVPANTSGAQHGALGKGAANGNGAGMSRFIPSPRIIFSILAAYGAFGYAFVEALHMPLIVAYPAALVPAILLERLALTPLWNLLLGFQGTPCTPLEHLVLAEAEAVTPFRNGKGIVRVVRDGRDVQFSARLLSDQVTLPVRVGDKLRVEEVDADGEHLKVSLH